MSFDVYTSLLKMFEEFSFNSDGVHLSYDLSSPELFEIKQKYMLDNIAGKGSDFSKAKNILFWLSKNCYHNGNFNFKEEPTGKNILEHSYQKGIEYGVNCSALAEVLTDCFLSLGFMARTMFIMPFSPYDHDNHTVTHVYINEIKKWVMMDPTFSCYVMNKEKIPLDLFEIRDLLSNQNYIEFNEEAKYNDEKRTKDSEEIKEYYAKDLFYFVTSERSCYNVRKDNREIHIIPANYDVKKKEILNVEYRRRKNGDAEWLQNWLQNIRENKYLFSLPFEVIKEP